MHTPLIMPSNIADVIRSDLSRANSFAFFEQQLWIQSACLFSLNTVNTFFLQVYNFIDYKRLKIIKEIAAQFIRKNVNETICLI
jgi:hypothetical protein